MTPNQHDIDQQADAADNGQLKTPVEAQQAVKTHHVRWMLGASLVMGVVVLGGAYAWYASLSAGRRDPPAIARRRTRRTLARAWRLAMSERLSSAATRVLTAERTTAGPTGRRPFRSP